MDHWIWKWREKEEEKEEWHQPKRKVVAYYILIITNITCTDELFTIRAGTCIKKWNRMDFDFMLWHQPHFFLDNLRSQSQIFIHFDVHRKRTFVCCDSSRKWTPPLVHVHYGIWRKTQSTLSMCSPLAWVAQAPLVNLFCSALPKSQRNWPPKAQVSQH